MKHLLAIISFLAFLLSAIALAEENNSHSLIKTDLKSLMERRAKEFKLLQAVSSKDNKDLKPGNVNLLRFVSTKGAMRDQKKCGNCWVWTGLAALEIFKNQYDEVNEATSQNSFSVGFVNAFYHDGGRSGSFACNGGFFEEFAKFFAPKGTANQRVIPWDNDNADFVDGDGGKPYKGNFVSNRTKDEISTTPYYYLSNLAMRTINIQDYTDNEIINVIKNNINRGIPVALGFFMTGPNDWRDFNRFWDEGTSSQIFDIGSRTDKYNQKYMQGHAVLVIGYDDTSSNSNEHHWIALNSWGTPSGHPDGTFKIKMHMDYKSSITDGFLYKEDKMEWHIYTPVFASSDPLIENGELSGKLIDPIGAGVKDVAVVLDDKEVVLTDQNGRFSFGKIPAYKTFKLNFIRAGYKFNPDVYRGTITKISNNIEIEVENDEVYSGCKGSTIDLKNVESNVEAIFNLGKKAAGKLNNKTTVLKTLNNARKAYLSALNLYPRVSYQCSSSCTTTSFSSYKLKLHNAINKLTNLAQNNWKKCLNQKKVKANIVASKKKKILLKRNQAFKQLQDIPANGDLCE